MTKILLVEDDKSLREIYGVRLLAEGYDIISAGDGEQALAMAIKEKPILIISDVMMPKISGFDMLDILRSTTETRDIKVIMMTALSSEDQRARGEQLGADRYLVKSQVGIEDVVRTVHEVLGDVPGATTAAATPATVPTPAAAPEPTTEPAAVPADTSVTPDSTDIPAPADDVANSSAAPGNDAGPLPPQPTEVAAPAPVIEPVVPAPVTEPEVTDTTPTLAPAPEESSLPQPTAPFSSPRPTNLGEQVVHPDDALASVTASETPATPELPGGYPLTATPETDGGGTGLSTPAESATDSTATPTDSTTPPAAL